MQYKDKIDKIQNNASRYLHLKFHKTRHTTELMTPFYKIMNLSDIIIRY